MGHQKCQVENGRDVSRGGGHNAARVVPRGVPHADGGTVLFSIHQGLSGDGGFHNALPSRITMILSQSCETSNICIPK